MKRYVFGAVCVLFLIGGAGAHADQRIGAGLHYWRTVDSLGGEFDRDGVSYFLSYQTSVLPLLRLQADLQIFPSTFAGSDRTVYAPQALALVGKWIYAGVGVGILYADSSFADRPFYLLRAGLDLPILPSLRLDINANYHFSEWKGINEIASDIESDTITLGAALRLSF